MISWTLLILLSPFAGFLLNIFFGRHLSKFLSGLIGILSVIISLVATYYLFNIAEQSGAKLAFTLFDWIQTHNFTVGFSFLIDRLSFVWLFLVLGVGSLIHLYSISYMNHDEQFHKFFAYMNLFIFFMVMLVIGGNLLVTFIGWEGVGLCSYLLIGFWHKNHENNDAAKKAFIMNRIGDLGFLIGIFTLGFAFSTLDYSSLQTTINSTTNHNSVLLGIAALSIFIGACGKSAQIPLYTWLPDAMAGPTPVSALIHAATMVTAGVFILTRMNFLFDLAPLIQTIIAITGVTTSFVAATIAVFQNDIKKVLAYSTVSQLGLMFLALGLGAYQVAVFHVITHAFFKGCLFLGAGSVIHALGGEQDIRKMGGLKMFMPITFITMMVAALAISGIFPFAGFWSKDEILMTAFKSNSFLWIVASLASVMTAFYMFRLMFLTFFNNYRGEAEKAKHLHESPILITIPLFVLALLSFIGGLISMPSNSILNKFLTPVLPKLAEAHEGLSLTDYLLMAVALTMSISAIYYAYVLFYSKRIYPPNDSEMKGLPSVIYNKYYIDQALNFLLVKPLNVCSSFFGKYFETTIYTAVISLGTMVKAIGNKGKAIQNGNIELYFFIFVAGMSAILTYIFLI